MEVRLWHEFVGYVGLIAARTTEGRSLFARAFLCELSWNEGPPIISVDHGMADRQKARSALELINLLFWQSRRSAFMPICILLKGVSKPKHSSLAKAWSGDLQADWQSGTGETTWN